MNYKNSNKGIHISKQNKHQNGVNTLYEKLKDKIYIKDIDRNVEYSQGEMDVYALQGNCMAGCYYEYKTNHTERGLTKAINQLLRMTRYYKSKFKNKDFYGLYVTSKTKPVLIAKNGELKCKNSDLFSRILNHYMK